MKENSLIELPGRQEATDDLISPLDQLVREGARRMLQAALEAEVADYIEHHRNQTNERGHRLVIRNGHLPERDITTGVGPVEIKQPRVRDKRKGKKFTSKILPPFLRRVPSVDALIPIVVVQRHRYRF